MLIAHLADFHLGYRAYHRAAPDGVNQRERDISEAVGRALDGVVAAAPDLVIVAGDIFHSSRPSNAAIMQGFRHFTRLRGRLPGTPIILVAGNHDAPRAAGGGSILRLLAEIPNVHVVDDEARVIRPAGVGARVLCVPHPALARGAAGPLEPEPGDETNVLVAHATVTGAGLDEARVRAVEPGGAVVARSDLREEAWDYIALGHHHTPTEIAAHVWYAGATERVAPDVWLEAGLPRGWVLFDTGTGRGELQEIATREVVDLPPIDARARGPSADGGDEARWLEPTAIDAEIRAGAESIPGGVSGRIVRQVVTGLPRELFRRLDHGQVRALKAEALHYQLEARRPTHPGALGRGRPGTLEDELNRFLTEWEPAEAGVDRARLVTLGERYLRDVVEER